MWDRMPSSSWPFASSLRDITKPSLFIRILLVLFRRHGLATKRPDSESHEPADGVVGEPALSEAHILGVVVYHPWGRQSDGGRKGDSSGISLQDTLSVEECGANILWVQVQVHHDCGESVRLSLPLSVKQNRLSLEGARLATQHTRATHALTLPLRQ